jgi:hypothetical protein
MMRAASLSLFSYSLHPALLYRSPFSSASFAMLASTMSKDSIEARNAYYKGQLAAKKVVTGKVKSLSRFVTENLRDSEQFAYWANGAADEFKTVGRDLVIGLHEHGDE